MLFGVDVDWELGAGMSLLFAFALGGVGIFVCCVIAAKITLDKLAPRDS
jgi:hypothetical protein